MAPAVAPSQLGIVMTAKFTVRSEVDFIALAPVVLGFHPTHSLVMMSVDSFSARLDLPDDESDFDLVVRALLDPSKRNGVGRVAFVVFDDGDYDALLHTLVDTFTNENIQVLTALQADKDTYRKLDGDWMPLDIASHHLVLEAQYQDATPKFRSRDELAEWVRPRGEAWTIEASEAVERLRADGLDSLISSFTRENAKEAVALWTVVMRGCQPDSELARTVALVLAFAGWLSGDGAMAWVALDLADESSTWHELLTLALQQGINPERWSEMLGAIQ